MAKRLARVRKVKHNRHNNARQRRKKEESQEDLGEHEIFSDDIESGSLATNWPTRTGAVSAVAGSAFAGNFGALINPAGAASNIATSTGKWAQNTHPWFRLQCRLRINTLQATGTADLITVQNNNLADHIDLFLNNTTRAFRIDISGSEGIVLDTEFVPEEDVWYFVQIIGFYGGTTYQVQLKIDNTLYDVLQDTGEVSSHVRSLHIGTGGAKTYSISVDDIVMTVSEGEPHFT